MLDYLIRILFGRYQELKASINWLKGKSFSSERTHDIDYLSKDMKFNRNCANRLQERQMLRQHLSNLQCDHDNSFICFIHHIE